MNYETLEQNIDNMIVVLDTNILLYLYKCSSSTSDDLLRLLNKIKENIIVPAQVINEYNKHKSSEQAKVSKKYDNFEKELTQKINSLENKLKERISEAKKYNFPKCNDLEEKISNQIGLLKTEVHKYSLEIAAEKEELIKNSQITEIDSFVSYLVVNNKIRKELDFRKHLEFIKEEELRYKYCIPPGYEDGKNKAGVDKYGDLFVWKEILEIGKENRDKYIVFITNDCKEDWWILKGENKQCDRMRDELRKEFIDETQNDRIEFITLNKFFDLFSRYHQVQSRKTDIELNALNYINNTITKKYYNQLMSEVSYYLFNLNYTDFDDEFYRGVPEPNYEDPTIGEFNVYFEKGDAVYNIKYESEAEVDLGYEDNENDYFRLGDVSMTVVVTAEIRRKITSDDVYELNIVDVDHKEITVVNPYDLYYDPSDMEDESGEYGEYY